MARRSALDPRALLDVLHIIRENELDDDVVWILPGTTLAEHLTGMYAAADSLAALAKGGEHETH